ncbi:heavy metal-associated domain-containing protein [Actinocorallia sp. B10E7]|uniref:heavy-metal-associated domain-containing protein n=1 Tax=Actinocorallia sp. B10E7 TaxID=3153558 RepID=UPI00325EF6AC
MSSTATYTVSGMTCGGCASKVRERVGRVTGVTGVEVDLGARRVTVTGAGPIDDTAVRGVVEEAGYKVED